MTTHHFEMSEDQARNVHRVVASHIAALHNHIATGVETNDTGVLEPKKLVAELREFQALFAAFNMDSKHQYADASGKPIKTTHIVENTRGR